MRFFAHDARSSGCALNGETMAHRLLKLELACAVRDAGWRAQLEATGPGFRADVLAVSPDGADRVVWEAQLAGIAVDKIRERTATITSSGARVCWVTDRDTAWLGVVPAVVISNSASVGEVRGTPIVRRGVARFVAVRWCAPRSALTLSAFVELLCHRGIVQHRPRLACSPEVTLGSEIVWTAPAYVEREATATARNQAAEENLRRWWVQVKATQHGVSDPDAAKAWSDTRPPRWSEEIGARWARLQAITPLACKHLSRAIPGRVSPPHPRLGPASWGDWAGGVPLLADRKVRALVCPNPNRLRTWRLREQLRTLTIYVGSDIEAAEVERACPPGQLIVVISC